MATYTVQQGDYMWKIANDHGISLDALIAANPQVADPAAIECGQVLNLPGNPAGGDRAPPPAESAAPASAPAPSAGTERGVVNIASAVPGLQRVRPGLKTVGYFTNWVKFDYISYAFLLRHDLTLVQGIYGRNYQPADIPANHLTHILCKCQSVRLLIDSC